ncbi:YczI family protein [Halalkalibacter alkalisediminis]|uniref:YczI family protein n=1 Tax=Halalkalibacter alkalisediminis TaxID=935616 RepID=A0ABV6NQ72_9BACI|nr:YczI family protein [Halalkalibacter alkalisediminis]
MLKILRIIFAIIVLILGGYGSITGNYEAMPYMMFFLGAMLFVMGVSEIKMERKRMGYFSIIVSLFVFYVSMEGFLFN